MDLKKTLPKGENVIKFVTSDDQEVLEAHDQLSQYSHSTKRWLKCKIYCASCLIVFVIIFLVLLFLNT